MSNSTNRQAIRDFIGRHYSDATLAKAIDDARASALCYETCCCLIGRATEHDHFCHADRARKLEGGQIAELAYEQLGNVGGNELRNRVVLPILLAEARRRMRARLTPSEAIEPELVSA